MHIARGAGCAHHAPVPLEQLPSRFQPPCLLSRPCPALQSEKVLLIVNEPNQNVYLSGRNVPTLAINTANAVQVCV